MQKNNKNQHVKPGRATVDDIARKAGVSTATVSRALNTPDRVRPERLARVRAAIGELGYVPHGAAQTLASRRSMTVGAVIPTLDNAIFAQGLAAFQAPLQAAGYTLLLASSDYDLDAEAGMVDTLVARRIDALMLVGQDHRPEVFERLAQHGVPYVLSWAFEAGDDLPYVGFNNRAAARDAADAVLAEGHTEIAVIAGLTAENDRARDRLAGFADAVTGAGGTLDPARVIEMPYDLSAGRDAMLRLLDAPQRPTAVLCGNDVLAVGALMACRDRDLVVPDDISIVGFDDLPWAAEFRPALTTMQVPAEAMGRAAAEVLLADLNGAPPPDERHFPATLVRRDTLAAPRRP